MEEEIYATLGEVGVSVGMRGGTVRRVDAFFSSDLCRACAEAKWILSNFHRSDGTTFEHYTCQKKCEQSAALNLEIEYAN